MRVLTGIVRHGAVEVDVKDLPDGTAVTVLVPEHADETFEVTAEEETRLLEAIRELERGEGEDGWHFLRSIRPK